jgi:TRAP-type C4-dicarboxylate transport system substrate-binding protein
MKRILAGAICLGLMAGMVRAEVQQQRFKVIGLWNIGPMYSEVEAPTWTKFIPEASNGRITADVQSVTDLGLKGFETVKLLQSGVFDAGFGAYVYIASGNPVFEGVDLALAGADSAETRKLVDAYTPVVGEAFERIHRVKLLANYPYPAQQLACRDRFTSLTDLKGRKIRVYSTTLGDMVEGLGGISVTIPLADVVPALQRGVVDCGITSGVSMYGGKWQDVVKYVYATPVSAGIGFLAMSMTRWNGLDAETQSLLMKQAAAFSDRAWQALAASDVQSIACLTGEGGECRHGKPADMKLVRPAAEDGAARKKLLADFVLKRFAVRCGPECAKQWNDTAGAVIGVRAEP